MTPSVFDSRASTPCPSTARLSETLPSAPNLPLAIGPSAPAQEPSQPRSPSVVGGFLAMETQWDGGDWEGTDDSAIHTNAAHIEQRPVPTPVNCVRTPPPHGLAQAYDSADLSDAESSLDDRTTRQEPQPFVANINPRAMNPAPTTAELVINRAKELRDFKDGSKGRGKSKKQPVTQQSLLEKSMLSVMRGYLTWHFLAKAPWSRDEYEVINQAKDFALVTTGLSIDETTEHNIRTTAFDGLSKLRGRPHPAVLEAVVEFYKVTAGDLQETTRLTTDSRFLYPDDRMRRRDFCNVAVLGTVLELILFPGNKNIGMIFMDKLLQTDDPAEIEVLLDVVALPGPDGVPVRPEFADTSAPASRGVPISALAYACILVEHALDRLKNKEKKREFHRTTYADHWAYYVRELVQSRRLGAIRATFTDVIKKAYCSKWTRKGRPIGDDHAW